jgi:hypothetical protein
MDEISANEDEFVELTASLSKCCEIHFVFEGLRRVFMERS